MPRTARSSKLAPRIVVHLIIRFVDGRFVIDDLARAEYLRRLERALRRSDWELISFAIMSNHIHLGLVVGWMSLDSWIRPLHVGMATWINRRMQRTVAKPLGHVFADRPTTHPVPLAKVGRMIAYQHINPEAASVVAAPEDSAWTSHRAYVGIVPGPDCLRVELGLRLMGFEPDGDGRARFAEYVRGRIGREIDEEGPLTSPLELLPPANNVYVVTGDVAPTRTPTLAEVVRASAKAARVHVLAVTSGDRSKSVVVARRVALRVWRDTGGRVGDMAEALGITAGAASHLLNRRHDPRPVDVGVLRVLSSLAEAAESKVKLASPAKIYSPSRKVDGEE